MPTLAPIRVLIVDDHVMVRMGLKQVLDSFQKLKLPHTVFNLPCGHYTTGQFPFNLMDGLAMCRYASRYL